MKNQKITVLTISDQTGTLAPLAGANGELGRLALQSSVDNMSAGLGMVLNGSSDATTSLTTVSHPAVDVNNTYPVVAITSPTSSSLLVVQGITNRTSTSFDVILSTTPTSGYKINWQMFTSGTGYVSKSYGVQEISGSTTSNIYFDAANKEVKNLILDANVTIYPLLNMVDGQLIVVKATQDSIGGKTISYDSAFKFPGGISVAATSAANATDIITFLKIGNNYFTTVVQDLY